MPGNDGYSYGYSYGYGYGSGSGSGYGYGEYGRKIATINEHDVLLLAPWPLVRVGCQALTLDKWRENWRELADSEGIDISHQRVSALLRKARRGLSKWSV